jgi:hypothetical protein
MPVHLDLRAVYPNHPGTPPSFDVEWADVQGLRAIYRIAFQSMVVNGLAAQIQIGRVMLLQTSGPVPTRHTDIVQRPQARLVWDKTAYDERWIGAGLPLTVCHLPVVVPTAKPAEEEKPVRFGGWRDEITAAAGVLVASLDERIAQRELFDDFLVFDAAGGIHPNDLQLNVRRFLPFPVTDSDQAALHALGSNVPDNALAAARSYLRGAQPGPAPEGIPLFWTALEMLVGAEGRQVVRKVKDALRATGEDPEKVRPSLGRLFGLRADIVHRGKHELEADLLLSGWYVLERICRKLLRERLRIEVTWPDSPADSSGLGVRVRLKLGLPQKTVWHEPDERP